MLKVAPRPSEASKNSSMSEANPFLLLLFLILESNHQKTAPRPSETRSKCHERSECHRAVFHSQIPFYTFKKLLKAFRHPPNADEYRLVEFKKLQTPSIKLQTPSQTHFKNYKRQVLKLQTPSINLLDYVCRLIYKFYIV